MTPDGIEEFESVRPRLFAIAYRMLGRVSDAEDVVQETFLRFQRALRKGTEIESTPAFLSSIVTRLSINELQSARARREVYVGEWLPEPLFTDADGRPDDPAAHAEEADSLSLAFLVLLEQLTPVERAVFLLHDVFGYAYGEVATTVGRARTIVGSSRRGRGVTSRPRSRGSRRHGGSATGLRSASSPRPATGTSTSWSACSPTT
ncbi:MAG TPA: sigma-70 family RNA polymerase sigma factor [Gaiellaceae bacterium]|nr:sigma-70 family RNA polymerase sigma factor [Gaiellaceae bacterium]